jgi:anti-anti-sigma factor
MDIRTTRQDGIPVIELLGRMDAFGAQETERVFDVFLQPDDISAVLDLAGMPYLSSGGIRLLHMTHRRMAQKGGGLRLACLGDYPRQVLEMAGFDQVFAVHGTVAEGVVCSLELARLRQSQQDWSRLPCYEHNNVTLAVFQTGTGPAALSVAGSLDKVLHATITGADIVRRRFSETEYSIGLGALGAGIADCLPVLGEMITIGGTMVWLPTDGHDTPDFLIPRKDTGMVAIFTGLNLALAGGFNDIMVMESAAAGGVSLGELYSAIFAFARKTRPDCHGLISVAQLADVQAVYSSGVKLAPIKERTPRNGGTIMDKENAPLWMDLDTSPSHGGSTMVAFGVGLDLGADISYYGKDVLDNIFYLNPANTADKKVMLHNHGVIFEKQPWEKTLELDPAIKQAAQRGAFVDMRHLLDNTRVSRAILGVSYIKEIRRE